MLIEVEAIDTILPVHYWTYCTHD